MSTPTGVALICGLSESWQAPDGRVLAVGCGAGHREQERLPGFCRVSIVETDDTSAQDTVSEIRAVVDDSSGEALAAATRLLLDAGAKDCWTVPIVMKKGRPAWELVVLAPPDQADHLANLVLTHTSSIGCRQTQLQRRVLPRRQVSVETESGPVAGKVVSLPDGSERFRPEADAVATAAQAFGRSFEAVYQAACAAWSETQRNET
jgi:uncharacterized protein (DUF111 family)